MYVRLVTVYVCVIVSGLSLPKKCSLGWVVEQVIVSGVVNGRSVFLAVTVGPVC